MSGLIRITNRGTTDGLNPIITPLGMITGGYRVSALSVGTSATEAPAAALSGRMVIAVFNVGTEDIFVVNEGDSDTSSGLPIPSGTSQVFNMSDDVTLYLMVDSGTVNCRIFEGRA